MKALKVVVNLVVCALLAATPCVALVGFGGSNGGGGGGGGSGITQTAADARYQPLATNLSTFAGIAPSANAQTLLAETWAQMLVSLGAMPLSGGTFTGPVIPYDFSIGIAPNTVLVGTLGAALGDSTSTFTLTKATNTVRYTQTSGTSLGITADLSTTSIRPKDWIVIATQNFNAANGTAAAPLSLSVTAVGADYFEVTNAAGVAESGKTIGTGSIKLSKATATGEPTLASIGTTIVPLGTVSASTTINWALGAQQTLTMPAGALTLAFSNLIVGHTYKLDITVTANTITWPSGITWVPDNGTTHAPEIPAAGKHLYATITCESATPTFTGFWGTPDPASPAPSDTAYDATTWDGVTTIPPSKNAVRDKIELVETEITGKLSTTAPAYIDGSAGTGPTAAQMADPRCTCSNYGQAASDVAVALPVPTAGLSCLFQVSTAQSNKWGVRAAANDKIYLIAADGTIAAGSDNGYARMTAAQVGQAFACWSGSFDGGSTYDWRCKAIAIGTSTFAAN